MSLPSRVTRQIHRPAPVPGLDLRPMEPADATQIRALDTHAYGAARDDTMAALFGSMASEVIAASQHPMASIVFIRWQMASL